MSPKITSFHKIRTESPNLQRKQAHKFKNSVEISPKYPQPYLKTDWAILAAGTGKDK